MSIDSLCNTSLSVERMSAARDASGGSVETWASHHVLQGRIQPLSSQQRNSYSNETTVITHRVYFPGGIDISASTDRLRFSDTYGVSRYLIIHGVRNIDEQGRLVTCECEEQDVDE
jgi:head-tail adaptor